MNDELNVITTEEKTDLPVQVPYTSGVAQPNKKKKAFLDILRKQFNPTVALLLVAVIVLSVVLCSVSAKLSEQREIHRAIYDKSQQIEVAGESDRISLYDYSIGETAIPAIKGVPVCTYKEENFLTDNKGYKYYYEDAELCSYVGIDVSGHNGNIDWDKVKASGVDFVMLRIGGRGYGTEGVMYNDTYFKENLRGAKAAGLSVGAYFFSQAATVQEAKEEAEYTLSLLGGEKLQYPIAFDWEIVESAEGTRIDNISPQTLTDCARVFCDTIKDAGYIPCIYTGTTLAYYKYHLGQLSDIDLWYAFYSDTPNMYYNYTMWQYSCTGVVDGIEGDVDLNICFKNYN